MSDWKTFARCHPSVVHRFLPLLPVGVIPPALGGLHGGLGVSWLAGVGAAAVGFLCPLSQGSHAVSVAWGRAGQMQVSDVSVTFLSLQLWGARGCPLHPAAVACGSPASMELGHPGLPKTRQQAVGGGPQGKPLYSRAGQPLSRLWGAMGQVGGRGGGAVCVQEGAGGLE